MAELIKCMCKDIAMLNHDMVVTAKNFKKQGKVNRSFALLFIFVGIYASLNECQKKEYTDKIESLTYEIEELKKSKGE